MKGLLLVNTGSPASPHRRDVRAFVEAMLSDPLVMTVPDWFRPILVKGIIGPFRQFGSAKKYDLIWDKELDQSPLLFGAEELARMLEKQTAMPVEVGMRYLNPGISKAMAKLDARNSELTEIVVLPLFPQYAESSYLTAVEEVKRAHKDCSCSVPIRIIEPYFNHPAYIKAIAASMKPYLEEDYERVVFNFHSLPLDHVEKGFEEGKEFDYVYQAKETVRLIQHELDLDVRKVRIVFSSAFGKKWLEPALTDQVEEMAKSGIEKIVVVSPGFAADNLETLFDIDIEARNIFVDNGGKELRYVPCLNSQQIWVDAVQQIIL